MAGTSPDLAALVDTLTPEEQAIVAEFVRFVRGERASRGGPENRSAFLAAVEEFMTAHPELLRRLAQ
jgi:hypothetical protein